MAATRALFAISTQASNFPPTPTPKQSPSLRRSVRRNAAGDGVSAPAVYDGVYGPWSVEASDVKEVVLYRSGLVTAAASFVVGASSAFLPLEIVEHNLDLLYALGSCGLRLSLFLIHIYVTPIKRTLQALWGIGAIGSALAYAQSQGDGGLVLHVLRDPSLVWLVGPLFASLTGLVFKEGLCYGKLEAGLLTFIIPSLLLGHLSGLMDDGVKQALLGSWMLLFGVFAARKFTQPIKDDIGDKSVFMFLALPEDEKRALVEKMEKQQKLGQSVD